jgi:hypothetical protein
MGLGLAKSREKPVARGRVCFSLPTGRQAGGPPAKLHEKPDACGWQAVSPANRPEGRLPSSMPRGFSPLSPAILRLGRRSLPFYKRRRQSARQKPFTQMLLSEALAGQVSVASNTPNGMSSANAAHGVHPLGEAAKPQNQFRTIRNCHTITSLRVESCSTTISR